MADNNKIMIGEEELTEEEVNAGFALLGLCLITIPIISIGFGVNVVLNRREKKKLKKYIDTLEEEIQCRRNETIDLENINKSRAEETLRCVTRTREALSAPGMHFDENIRVADNWLDAIEALAKNVVE